MRWNTNKSRAGIWAAALLVLLSFASTLMAQQLVGNIYGYVSDEQGGRLPGVTVTLTGGGAPKVADDGCPRRVSVRQPRSGHLHADLRAPGLHQGRRSPTCRSRSARTPTRPPRSRSRASKRPSRSRARRPCSTRARSRTAPSSTRTQLQDIPTARDPWVILQTIPGVQIDRVNVGGNESGQQSNYAARGSQADQNVWSVDGVTITDMSAARRLPDVLRLRLLRGDARLHRRQRRDRASSRRAAEHRHQAGHQRHPRLRPHLHRRRRPAVEQHLPGRHRPGRERDRRQPRQRGPGLRRRGRRTDHPGPPLALGRVRAQPGQPPERQRNTRTTRR